MATDFSAGVDAGRACGLRDEVTGIPNLLGNLPIEITARFEVRLFVAVHWCERKTAFLYEAEETRIVLICQSSSARLSSSTVQTERTPSGTAAGSPRS